MVGSAGECGVSVTLLGAAIVNRADTWLLHSPSLALMSTSTDALHAADTSSLCLAVPARASAARLIATLLMLALAALVGHWLLTISSALSFQDDAAQTLSTASHWLHGQGLRTSILYYDSQLAQLAPALQTVWPPAAPVLAATMAALTGLSLANSLLLVLFGAHLLTAALLALALRLSTGTRRQPGPADGWLAAAIMAAWVLSVPALLNVSRGLAEPLFQMAAMAALVALLVGCRARTGGQRTVWLLLAGVGISLSILSRYQALALIAPLALAATLIEPPGTRWPQRLRSAALATVLPGLVTIVLLGRNTLITNSLTGGAHSDQGQTLVEIAARISWLPVHWQLPGLMAMLASCAFAALLAGLLWVRGFDTCRQRPARFCQPGRLAVVFCLSAYSANLVLLLALALTSTVYAIEMRYLTVNALFLVVPLVLAVRQSLGRAGPTIQRWLSTRAMAVIIMVGALLQFIALQGPLTQRIDQAPAAQVARILQAHKIGELSAADWLQSRLSADTVLLSSHAHSLSLMMSDLGQNARTVLGVPLPVYTNKDWSEQEIHAMATRHSVHYLIAFRELPTWVYQDPINTLLDQTETRSWLQPLVQTRALFIGKVLSPKVASR